MPLRPKDAIGVAQTLGTVLFAATAASAGIHASARNTVAINSQLDVDSN